MLGFAQASGQQQIKIINLQTGDKYSLFGGPSAVTQVIAAGQLLVSGGAEGDLCLWDLRSKTMLPWATTSSELTLTIPQAHTAIVTGLAMNDYHLVSAGGEGVMHGLFCLCGSVNPSF